MPVVNLADVRVALNQVSGVDDLEVLRMLTNAEAAYAEYVGPLPGARSEVHRNATGVVILRGRADALTSVVFLVGGPALLTDYELDAASGLVFGPFAYRTVTVTYTVPPLPPHHYETIVADVAGYFEATQRGGQGGALPEQGYGEAFTQTGTPLTLFPRIRKLAPPRFG